MSIILLYDPKTKYYQVKSVSVSRIDFHPLITIQDLKTCWEIEMSRFQKQSENNINISVLAEEGVFCCHSSVIILRSN